MNTGLQKGTVIAIIPAGGVGQRAQAMQDQQAIPKQYRYIHHQTMLEHTVKALLAHPLIGQVHIGVAHTDHWIDRLCLPPACYVHRTGGESRAHTVLNTLKILDIPDNSWVLVHDAARPGLPLNCLDQLITQCMSQEKGGILALPVGDTVKRENSSSPLTIEKTLDRQGLWLAQTPQMFYKNSLEKALTYALDQHLPITDEASALELLGESCLLVTGHWKNNKVTWASDFELVEYFLCNGE